MLRFVRMFLEGVSVDGTSSRQLLPSVTRKLRSEVRIYSNHNKAKIKNKYFPKLNLITVDSNNNNKKTSLRQNLHRVYGLRLTELSVWLTEDQVTCGCGFQDNTLLCVDRINQILNYFDLKYTIKSFKCYHNKIIYKNVLTFCTKFKFIYNEMLRIIAFLVIKRLNNNNK